MEYVVKIGVPAQSCLKRVKYQLLNVFSFIVFFIFKVFFFNFKGGSMYLGKIVRTYEQGESINTTVVVTYKSEF